MQLNAEQFEQLLRELGACEERSDVYDGLTSDEALTVLLAKRQYSDLHFMFGYTNLLTFDCPELRPIAEHIAATGRVTCCKNILTNIQEGRWTTVFKCLYNAARYSLEISTDAFWSIMDHLKLNDDAVKCILGL